MLAYVKIVPIKQGTHLDAAVDYIKNPDKTEQLENVFAFMCCDDSVVEDFKEISGKAMKKGNNVAHHIIISFPPEDNVTPDIATEIGQQLMKEMYPNNQYILAIHTDREHTHCHILVNAVDYKNYKKIVSNKRSLDKMREICDRLCEEKGLSVIEKDSKKHGRELKATIDEVLPRAADFDNFVEAMQNKGYKVKIGDYLYFKDENQQNYRRSDTLGDAYSIIGIKQRLQGIEIPKGKKKIYSDKTIKISNRRRLQYAIDDMLKIARSYEELLELLRNEGIEIKQGKHLAMRLPIAERFIRVESIGEDYTEDMLKLYFEDKAKYNGKKADVSAVKQEYIKKPKLYNDRYTAISNIDTEIRMLNMLSEQSIKSIEDLQDKITGLQQQEEICNTNITTLTTQIQARQTILKAMQRYWQLKPLIEQYRGIFDKKAKEAFYVENMAKIDEYADITEILNQNKRPDGTLPKMTELRQEIEGYKQAREMNYENRDKTRRELEKYWILEKNIRTITGKEKTEIER